MSARSTIFCIIIVCCILLSIASAHVPVMVEGEHNRPATAVVIDDPTKSWVIYAGLPTNDTVDYYRLRMEAGEQIRLSVQTPEEGAFAPGLVVMGPGIQSAGTPPPFIRLPGTGGAAVIPGERPDSPFFEPFTPSKAYETAEITIPAPETGDYYVAVYADEYAGPYALAVGTRESYTLTEWLTIPVDVIGIHLWEGQSLAVILAPLIVVVAAGLLLIGGRQRRTLSAFAWAAVLAGLLSIGSGAMTIVQLIIAAMGSPLTVAILVTLIVALIPIVLGTAMLLIGLRRRSGITDRAAMVVLGIIGLFTWAGVIAGPVIAILSAVLPGDGKR